MNPKMASKIYYAQCWEDPRTLTQALSITRDDDVLSIASGGENTFALLLQNPRSVTAIDRNPGQIFLVELKIRAIQTLDYGDFVAFLGVRDSNTRDRHYAIIRQYLTESARWYWDQHIDAIRRGVIHYGKFEKYFSLFRRFVLPLVHGRKDIERLLEDEPARTTEWGELLDTQRRFYHEVWNNKRWRWFFQIFFGKFFLGRFGRDPSLFRYVRIEDIADELFQRTQRGFTEIPLCDNYFVEYILNGRYDELENAHPYLSEMNFHLLRDRVGEIRLVAQSLDSHLATLPPASFSKFNLSDIFEYMAEFEFERTLRVISRASRDSAKMTFWTLFVPREVPSALTSVFNPDVRAAKTLFTNDRTFFYGGFGVWAIQSGSSETLDVEKIKRK